MNRSRLTWWAFLALTPFLGIAACNDSAVDPRRVLTTVNVSVGTVTLEVGEMTGATASGFDRDGAPFSLGSVAFSSDAPTIAAVTPATGFILAISPGTTRIVATADGVVGERAITVARAPAIRINEVQSRGDGPGGWIELFNPTTAPVDISGWTLIDNNFFGPTFTYPPGSVIAPGGYLVTEEASLPFGLDAVDDARLFSRFGVLVDATVWVAQTQTVFGRCPDGTGTFIPPSTPTKGAGNACPAGGSALGVVDVAQVPSR